MVNKLRKTGFHGTTVPGKKNLGEADDSTAASSIDVGDSEAKEEGDTLRKESSLKQVRFRQNVSVCHQDDLFKHLPKEDLAENLQSCLRGARDAGAASRVEAEGTKPSTPAPPAAVQKAQAEDEAQLTVSKTLSTSSATDSKALKPKAKSRGTAYVKASDSENSLPHARRSRKRTDSMNSLANARADTGATPEPEAEATESQPRGEDPTGGTGSCAPDKPSNWQASGRVSPAFSEPTQDLAENSLSRKVQPAPRPSQVEMNTPAPKVINCCMCGEGPGPGSAFWSTLWPLATSAS